jgi:hypothetical protein
MMTLATLVLAAAPAPASPAQLPGEVLAEQKISALAGGPLVGLKLFDQLASDVGALGDVDGDGVVDVAVGLPGVDGTGAGTTEEGAVDVLLLRADGTVKAQVRIGSAALGGALDGFDHFGSAVDGLGDVDGDGVPDVAVGASGDDDGLAFPSSNGMGAVWILFLASDGSLKSAAKISATQGGFSAPLDEADLFGNAVAGAGDLDGDGTPDLAVGLAGENDGGNARGAIYLLYLNPDGGVKAQRKISSTQGGFAGALADGDGFGGAIARFDDLDGDGHADLAVTAVGDADGAASPGTSVGAIWILNLDAAGLVKGQGKISATSGGFTGDLDDLDGFGRFLAVLGDVDGDGVDDLAAGAPNDDDGGPGFASDNLGAVWVLLLNANGTVKAHRKISATSGGLAGPLDAGDLFGAVAKWDDDGATNAGACYALFLAGPASEPYGCGVNPPGSLLELAGAPVAGTTWTLGVDDPLGMHAPGAAAFVAVATAAAPGYPCGVVVPGLGMASPAAPGELLVSVAPPNPVAVLGPAAWTAAPAPVALPIPAVPALAGAELFCQGALIDGAGIGLTEARRATIQP